MSDTSLFGSDEEIERTKTEMLDNLDGNEVIAETPQKVKKKTKHRKKNNTKSINKNIPDTIKLSQLSECNQFNTSGEFCVTRNSAGVANVTENEYVNQNFKYKQPYGFFDIKDILMFTEMYLPVNVNIKTLGIYKQENFKTHYLMEHKNNSGIIPLNICLDLKLLNVFPSNDAAIEVYGFVAFKRNSVTNFPVFVVEFWTTLKNDFSKYLKYLKIQKRYVPPCYKNMVNCDQHNFTYLEDVDYTFEEINESCLNRKVDYIEQICSEIDQIMNIDEDIFA